MSWIKKIITKHMASAVANHSSIFDLFLGLSCMDIYFISVTKICSFNLNYTVILSLCVQCVRQCVSVCGCKLRLSVFIPSICGLGHIFFWPFLGIMVRSSSCSLSVTVCSVKVNSITSQTLLCDLNVNGRLASNGDSGDNK